MFAVCFLFVHHSLFHRTLFGAVRPHAISDGSRLGTCTKHHLNPTVAFNAAPASTPTAPIAALQNLTPLHYSVFFILFDTGGLLGRGWPACCTTPLATSPLSTSHYLRHLLTRSHCSFSNRSSGKSTGASGPRYAG